MGDLERDSNSEGKLTKQNWKILITFGALRNLYVFFGSFISVIKCLNNAGSFLFL